MLHKTVPTFQRATLRQSSALQHAHHGFRSKLNPLYTVMRSLHNDSDDLPSSQGPSEPPARQSWVVDRIYALQSDMDRAKLELNHHKECLNTQMHNIQIDLTGQIKALDSKIDSKIDTFRSEMKTSLSELRAELKQHENRLVWRVFLALAVGGVATMFMRGNPLQQTSHVEQK